jgi:4-hydroxy-tetrahydrodipicolinate synthase
VKAIPPPLKYALSLLGLMTPALRLPLVELSNTAKIEVAAALEEVCEGYAEYFVDIPRETRRTDRDAASR